MLGSVNTADYAGMMGAQGPALGIRRANEYEMRGAEQTSAMRSSGGTIEFATAAHGTNRMVVSQATTEPVTPLKTMAAGGMNPSEDGKGQFVDARA